MKRILIFCTALVISISLTSCSKYLIGQGTVDAFGDNRFYLTKDEFSENSFVLHDYERTPIEGAVDSGIHKYGEYSYIYTIGDKGYTKVNEKTGDVYKRQLAGLSMRMDMQIQLQVFIPRICLSIVFIIRLDI